MKPGDHVEITYREGKYTGTIWSAEISSEEKGPLIIAPCSPAYFHFLQLEMSNDATLAYRLHLERFAVAC